MTTDQERDLKRRMREQEFDAMVRSYLMDNGEDCYGRNRQFQFGGALNLVSTIRKAFSDAYESTGITDYETVAEELAKVEAMADLCYDDTARAA